MEYPIIHIAVDRQKDKRNSLWLLPIMALLIFCFALPKSSQAQSFNPLISFSVESCTLDKALEKDRDFFSLFVDFKGYVDFFLLHDCVDDNYNVKFWMDTPLFVSMPMPKNMDEYYRWIDTQLDFVAKRGKRIEKYVKSKTS